MITYAEGRFEFHLTLAFCAFYPLIKLDVGNVTKKRGWYKFTHMSW